MVGGVLVKKYSDREIPKLSSPVRSKIELDPDIIIENY